MGENKARITIVVTVYNKEKWIKRCLKSIFDQTDPNYELIIIDDQSTDNSLKICRRYCKSLKYKIVTQAHAGPSSARNKGVGLCKSDYIFFVDGDDYIASNTIEILNQTIDSSPELVVFGINHALEDGHILMNTQLPKKSYANKEEIRNDIVSLWDSNLMYSSCNKLFLLDVIQKNELFFKNKDFGEDLTFVCDFTRCCNSIVTVNQCLYTYREHRLSSQSKKIRDDLFEIRKDEFYELHRYFYDMEALNKDAVEYISRRYVERVIGCIENEASIWNHKSVINKYKMIRMIVEDNTVQESIKYAELRSRKMKMLTWLVKNKMPHLLFEVGMLISIVKNGFPKLFMILKMHR